MNIGSATTNQVRDGGKRAETKAFENRERYVKYLIAKVLRPM
jgi:hypothetical protein